MKGKKINKKYQKPRLKRIKITDSKFTTFAQQNREWAVSVSGGTACHI